MSDFLGGAIDGTNMFADQHPSAVAGLVAALFALAGAVLLAVSVPLGLLVLVVAALAAAGAFAVGAAGGSGVAGQLAAGFGRAVLVALVFCAIVGGVFAFYLFFEFVKMVVKTAWEAFFEG